MQIGGPTGAFVVIVSGIVAAHGMDGLLICTMMAGGILVLLGLTGLGSAIRFVPRPVVIGFTNGIAVLIASTQIKDFFGLRIDAVPSQFVPRMKVLLENAASASPSATLLAGGTLGIIVLCRIRFQRVPGAIAALAIGTLAAMLLRLPVETIGSRFGGVPSGLPTLALPRVSLHDLLTLFSPALTVALLGAIESLMSAVVADRMSGDKHDPNVELVAQGLANIASPLFGGLPATGAIARTATNVRSGAVSSVSGMIHAMTLLAVLLFAAPTARYIPLPVLAGILAMVAYNMGEWREIPKILKLTSAEVAVWLATFLLTVFADLTVAVEVGLVLAALVYIRSVTGTTTVSAVTREYVDDARQHALQGKFIPDCVTVVRIHGPFLFGATDKITPFMERVDDMSAIVILRLAEHDGHRRYGSYRAGRFRPETSGHRPDADPVRSPAAAGKNAPPGRLRTTCGRIRERLPEYCSRLGAGRVGLLLAPLPHSWMSATRRLLGTVRPVYNWTLSIQLQGDHHDRANFDRPVARRSQAR